MGFFLPRVERSNVDTIFPPAFHYSSNDGKNQFRLLSYKCVENKNTVSTTEEIYKDCKTLWRSFRNNTSVNHLKIVEHTRLLKKEKKKYLVLDNAFTEHKDGEKCVFGMERNECLVLRIIRYSEFDRNRLDTSSYSYNLEYLKDFHKWFSEWKDGSIKRRLATLPNNSTAYQSMTCFFTGEASEDCMSMIEGIIGLTEYYCRKGIETEKPVYFLPRRISQDLFENGFSRIRLAIGHGRLDHGTTSSAITKVNTGKEMKSCERLSK